MSEISRNELIGQYAKEYKEYVETQHNAIRRANGKISENEFEEFSNNHSNLSSATDGISNYLNNLNNTGRAGFNVAANEVFNAMATKFVVGTQYHGTLQTLNEIFEARGLEPLSPDETAIFAALSGMPSVADEGGTPLAAEISEQLRNGIDLDIVLQNQLGVNSLTPDIPGTISSLNSSFTEIVEFKRLDYEDGSFALQGLDSNGNETNVLFNTNGEIIHVEIKQNGITVFEAQGSELYSEEIGSFQQPDPLQDSNLLGDQGDSWTVAELDNGTMTDAGGLDLGEAEHSNTVPTTPGIPDQDNDTENAGFEGFSEATQEADNPDSTGISLDEYLEQDHLENITAADEMEAELQAEIKGSEFGVIISGAIVDFIDLNNNFNDVESFAAQTIIQTFGQNLGQEVYTGTGFENFGADLLGTGHAVGVGMIAGAITGDLIEQLDWNQEWSAVAGGVANAYVVSSLNYGIDLAISESASMGAMNWTNLGVQIATNLVMSELDIGQSEEGQILSAVGGIVGSFFSPVGTAVGTLIGGIVGDAFYDPPEARSIWEYDPVSGEFAEVYGGEWHGGSLEAVRNLAEGALQQAESLLDMIGGERLPTDIIRIEISHYKDNFTYQSSTGERFDNVDQIVMDIVGQINIEGGDNGMQAAIHNAGATSYAALCEAFGVAATYDYYQSNPLVLFDDQGEFIEGEAASQALQQARNNNGEFPQGVNALLLHDYLEQHPSASLEALVEQAEALQMDSDVWARSVTRINQEFRDSGFDTGGLGITDLTLEMKDGDLIISTTTPPQSHTVENFSDWTPGQNEIALGNGQTRYNLSGLLDMAGVENNAGPVSLSQLASASFSTADGGSPDPANIVIGASTGDLLDGRFIDGSASTENLLDSLSDDLTADQFQFVTGMINHAISEAVQSEFDGGLFNRWAA